MRPATLPSLKWTLCVNVNMELIKVHNNAFFLGATPPEAVPGDAVLVDHDAGHRAQQAGHHQREAPAGKTQTLNAHVVMMYLHISK